MPEKYLTIKVKKKKVRLKSYSFVLGDISVPRHRVSKNCYYSNDNLFQNDFYNIYNNKTSH